VLCNSDDEGNTDYISGVEVTGFSQVQPELAHLRIPSQRYAVFTHRDHVSSIRRTWFTIFNQWLPASGYQTTGGPEFERYGPEFDPRTGTGGFEIWIPVSAA
jgi:AraC family transcriptional regulator